MNTAKRLPSMIEGLEYLKRCNVPIGFIVDVGILTCTYPLIHCFPHKKHLLIEPVRSFHSEIHRIYTEARIDYKLLGCGAGRENGLRVLCEYARKGGRKVTHSRIFMSAQQAPVTDLVGCVDVEVQRIDSILDSYRVENGICNTDFFLLKLDVDGAEEEVVAGAGAVLNRCSVVVLEVPIAKIAGRITLLDQIGFQCVDIVDPCYYKGGLSQVDCIFVKKDLIRPYHIDPWANTTSIDFDQWYEGRYTHVR